MFKVSKSPTFTHVVSVMTPIDGGHVEETLKVTFNFLPTEEVRQFDIQTRDGFTAFLYAIVRSLDDLADEDGRPLPCNSDLRQRVLDMPNVREAIVTHYSRAVSKAKSGN